jgi:hypothetical protein
MRMNGDEDKMHGLGHSRCCYFPFILNIDVRILHFIIISPHQRLGGAREQAASPGGSISSSSCHIKGWEEHTSRQHLQEGLDKVTQACSSTDDEDTRKYMQVTINSV